MLLGLKLHKRKGSIVLSGRVISVEGIVQTYELFMCKLMNCEIPCVI